MSNKHYIYFHKNPVTMQVFYVGIGTNQRAYCFSRRSNLWHKYVKKYGLPVVEIVEKNLSIKDAQAGEINYISVFGRRCNKSGCLVNLTLGGEGMLGIIPSDATRKKMSQARKGKKIHSEESKRRMSEMKKGRIVSKETREKLRKSNLEYARNHVHPSLGIPRTQEVKSKISEKHKGLLAGEKHPLFGKPRLESVKQKLRDANIGKRASEETKKKMSISRLGVRHSDESIRKMALSKIGKRVSDETRLNMSRAKSGVHVGIGNPMYGKKHSEETKEKIRIAFFKRQQLKLTCPA